MEEMDRFFDALEARGGVQPAAEAPPVMPVGGIFLKDFQREALGDLLLFSACMRAEGGADSKA